MIDLNKSFTVSLSLKNLYSILTLGASVSAEFGGLHDAEQEVVDKIKGLLDRHLLPHDTADLEERRRKMEENEEPMPDGVICRGSYELGTACGKCQRCKENMPKCPVCSKPQPKDASSVVVSVELRATENLVLKQYFCQSCWESRPRYELNMPEIEWL